MRDETLNCDGIHRVYGCDVQVSWIHQKSIIDEKKKLDLHCYNIISGGNNSLWR
jgi:hypothetical protein